MNSDGCFRLGPFEVGRDGRMALAGDADVPRFHLTWRNLPVAATLMASKADPTDGELHLQAIIGRVPSTASPGPGGGIAEQRAGVFSLLRSISLKIGTSPATTTSNWRVQLLPDHRVMVQSVAAMTLPTSVTSLLTDVTLFLLALDPYLDLMADGGVETTGAAPAGMAKTWPG